MQTFGGATSSIDWPAGNNRLPSNSDKDLINTILMEATLPWTSNSIFEARRQFVMLAQSPSSNMRGLCRRFNISLAIKRWKGMVQKAKKACKIVLAPLTEVRCAVPKPLNWLPFRCVRTTPPGAVEKLLHISNFLVPLYIAQ